MTSCATVPMSYEHREIKCDWLSCVASDVREM